MMASLWILFMLISTPGGTTVTVAPQTFYSYQACKQAADTFTTYANKPPQQEAEAWCTGNFLSSTKPGPNPDPNGPFAED
jgi:hypothetical protein